MLIIYENKDVRNEILAFFGSQTRRLKVLDLGGGTSSWLQEYVTDIIDLNPSHEVKGVNYIKGDFYDNEIWESIPDKHYDFVNCSHTLEDLRDPKIIVSMISKKAKSGLIIVPHKYQEISKVESITWLGNSHHRWIFNILDNNFYAFAKSHYINPLTQSYFLNYFSRMISYLLNKNLVHFPYRFIKKHSFGKELQILFTDHIHLNYFNNDYAGESNFVSFDLMKEFIQTDCSYSNQNTIDDFIDYLIRKLE
jgi:hypothetical protein